MSDFVLITRPKDAAEKTAMTLHDAGVKTLIEPLLSIKPVSYDMPDMTRYGGLVITSATVLQYFPFEALSKTLPVYCVGKDTAGVVKDLKFDSVVTGSGQAQDLEQYLDKSKKYLHVSGMHTHHKFDVCDKLPVYEAVQAEKFSDKTVQAFKNKSIKLVTLYSARTAESFKRCIIRRGLEEQIKHVHVLSIHANVLDCVRMFSWQNTYTPDRPSGEAMIQAVKDIMR